MQERLKGYLTAVLGKWKSLERRQRLLLSLTAAALAAVIAASVYFATRPQMTPLFTNMDYAGVSQMQAALDSAGISSKVINNTTGIAVEAKDIDRARLATAAQAASGGSAPFTYADALSASGMGTTESVKDQNFLRVKESDMAQTIQQMSGVDKANVFINLPPQNNYFIQDAQKASATVFVHTKRSLTKDEGVSLAQFVATSVQGLELDNISIIDQNYNKIFSGTDQLGAGGADSIYELEQQRRNSIEQSIRQAFAPLYDDVKVIANVVLLTDNSQTTSVNYTNPAGDGTGQAGLIDNQQVNKQSATGSAPGAAPGLSANNASTPSYATQNQAGSPSSASVNDSAQKFLYNQTTRVANSLPGQFDLSNSSVSVILYKYHNYDELQMTRSGQLKALNETWEQFKDATTQQPIALTDSTIPNTIAKGTGITNLDVSAYDVPVFFDAPEAPRTNLGQIVMFAILAALILILAFGLIRRARPEDLPEAEQELSVEGLLASSQLEEEKEAKALEEERRLQEIKFSSDSEAKQQIEKFVDEKPEAVAALLRNWLNEEWD